MRITRIQSCIERTNPDEYRLWSSLSDDEKEEFEKKVFERERKALLNGTISPQQFMNRFLPGAYSYYNIAYMFRDGIGFAKNTDMFMRYLLSAYESGFEKAGWDLLETPEIPGERLGLISFRCRAVSSMSQNAPRRFIRKAEERSETHPEVAAAYLIEMEPKGRTFNKWYTLADGVFRADLLYRAYREYRSRGHMKKAMRLLNEAWEHGNLEAGAELGKVYFIGDTVPADRVKAKSYFETAAEKGYLFADSWLAMFTPVEPGGTPSISDPDPTDRTCRMSRRPYVVPRGELESAPEWDVLEDIVVRIAGKTKNYSNETFEITDTANIRRASNPVRYEMPNFRFKPTGFEMEWQFSPFCNARSNRPLDAGQIRCIMRYCIQSIIAPEGAAL